jgi:hypothetical protein
MLNRVLQFWSHKGSVTPGRQEGQALEVVRMKGFHGRNIEKATKGEAI